MQTNDNTISEIIFYALSVVVVSIPVVFAYVVYFFAKTRIGKCDMVPGAKVFSKIIAVVFVIECLCVVDAFFFEPNIVTVSRIELKNDKILDNRTHIRICQISDLHLARKAAVVDETIRKINAAHPDIILLTGDYLGNLKMQSYLVSFLKQLKPRIATYAVLGNWDHDNYMKRIFRKANIPLIDMTSATLTINDTRIVFSGLHDRHPTWKRTLRKNDIVIVVGHNPDEIYKVTKRGADYYFCGHTHGGQVRLPFYGGLSTVSIYGRRFEAGLYKIGKTTMYVNRGLTFEKEPKFRVRFLCPPEITLFDIVGNK